MLSYILALVFFVSTLVIAGDDGWHLDFTYTLVNEELDPIVSPNAQSTHMHKVIGGSRFGASYSFADYAAASCSSLRVQADKSNYWMPSESTGPSKAFTPLLMMTLAQTCTGWILPAANMYHYLL
jgi:hypothetical protein